MYRTQLILRNCLVFVDFHCQLFIFKCAFDSIKVYLFFSIGFCLKQQQQKKDGPLDIIGIERERERKSVGNAWRDDDSIIV